MSWKAGLIGAGLALAIAAGAVTFMSDKKAPDLPQVAAQQDTANQPASPLGSTTQALAEADIARMKAEAEAEKARAEAETAKAQAELAKAQAELAAARAEVDAARSKAETSPAKAPSQQAQPIPGNAATPQMTDGWLSREERKAVQAALIERKLLAGSADGIFGPASRKAISAFQQSSGFPPDGYLTPDQAGPLLSEGKAALAEIIKKAQPTEIAQAPAKTAPAALPQSTAQETAPAPASAVAASSAPITRKAGRAMGPQACRKCHGPEAGVWEGTKHFKSFSSVHRNSKAKKIVRAVGDKRMKKSATCALCHYTLDGASGAPIAGPSCESCHGNSENWIKIHNDYGPALKRDNESPAQKAERRKRASAAGMIWPDQLFDVAMNCNSCHGLANPLLSAEQAAAMLDNGHPINPDFELVEYSQGSVRHRFYPPNTGENPVLSQKEQAEYFAIGQIATYLSASQALGKTSHAGYATAQKARAAKAAKALASLKGRFAAVAAFLSSPSTSKARKAVASLSGQDLTAEVGGMLPSSFK
ncbi:MAG: peptidoglycan-binding protein [Magnetovibrionaceae bacterium]